jgi:hypothetical protein
MAISAIFVLAIQIAIRQGLYCSGYTWIAFNANAFHVIFIISLICLYYFFDVLFLISLVIDYALADSDGFKKRYNSSFLRVTNESELQ